MNTFDILVNIFFSTIHGPLFDRAFGFASWIFDPIPFIVLLILSLVVMFKVKGLWPTLFLLGSILVAFVISWSLKFSFNIARPLQHTVFALGPSFPSSHATVATAYFGVLLYFVRKTKDRLRRMVHILFCILCPLFVGVSRLYLGVHWFSDMVFGFIFGAVSVYVTMYALRRMKDNAGTCVF